MSTRAILFIDAENLVFRYQAMLDEGRSPAKGVVHERDIFVWHPAITRWCLMDLMRVYLYTSMVGDDDAVAAMRTKIASIHFYFQSGNQEGGAQIVPVVFKKAAKSHKSRQVDIQITIDMMRFAHNPAVGILYLASGDGDYVPLLHELMRHGKEVYVAALSSGLAPQLQWTVDDFRSLDSMLFEPKPAEGAPGEGGA